MLPRVRYSSNRDLGMNQEHVLAEYNCNCWGYKQHVDTVLPSARMRYNHCEIYGMCTCEHEHLCILLQPIMHIGLDDLTPTIGVHPGCGNFDVTPIWKTENRLRKEDEWRDSPSDAIFSKLHWQAPGKIPLRSHEWQLLVWTLQSLLAHDVGNIFQFCLLHPTSFRENTMWMRSAIFGANVWVDMSSCRWQVNLINFNGFTAKCLNSIFLTMAPLFRKTLWKFCENKLVDRVSGLSF